MSSALSLAESMLQSGQVAAAFKLLMDFPDQGARRNFLLGQCAARLGNGAVAISALSQALAADPRHAGAATLLGNLFTQLGMTSRAEALYTDFLRLGEDDTIRNARARLMAARGDIAQGLVELNKVLQRNPDHASARQDRADMLTAQKRYVEAAADYQALAERFPGHVAPWTNLGVIQGWLEQHDAAVASLERAVAIEPGNGRCLFELAWACIAGGRITEARAALARLREKDPARWTDLQRYTEGQLAGAIGDDIDPRPLFLGHTYQRLDQCDWSRWETFNRVFADFAADLSANPAGGAHCAGIARLDNAQKRHMMEHAAAFMGRGALPWLHMASPAPARLRVGYVLPHLGIHVVATILERLWAAHSADIEVVLVSTAMKTEDYESALLRRITAQPRLQWLDVTGQPTAQAAAALHGLKLDIIVDLGIYNDQARADILAWRPAPVQVNWLGAPYTSGAAWMDYIITDPVVSPPAPGWCSEAEVMLPQCYFVLGSHIATPPAVPPRKELGLPEGCFIYSGLHNGYKIDPDTFACWMRILAATPGSVLLLKDGKERRPNLLRAAAEQGIGAERLVFAAQLPEERYLARQGAVDLFLDTRLYNGHTTMAESLWMGVPGLSCPGADFPGRVGASLLASCGLEELVVPDWERYEAVAIELFHDQARYQALRQRLLERRATAAPFDVEGQARALERAYRHMRQRFADGLPPAPFRVADLG